MTQSAYQWMRAEHRPAWSEFRFTTRALVDQRVITTVGDEICRATPPGSRVVLDFDTVIQLGSAMLARLLELRGIAERGGGRVVLKNLRPELRDLFKVTQTEKFFTFESDDDE